MRDLSPRVRCVNDRAINPDGDFVLYWMIAARRTRWSPALERAIAWAVELGKPLVVLEALRADYPWASARFHKFVIDGMAENGHRLGQAGVLYYPYVEPAIGKGRGLLARMAKDA